MSKKSIEELTEIGIKIGSIISSLNLLVKVSSVSLEDLETFREYLKRQDAVGSLLKPEFFAFEKGFEKVAQARTRVDLIEYILKEIKRC